MSIYYLPIRAGDERRGFSPGAAARHRGRTRVSTDYSQRPFPPFPTIFDFRTSPHFEIGLQFFWKWTNYFFEIGRLPPKIGRLRSDKYYGIFGHCFSQIGLNFSLSRSNRTFCSIFFKKQTLILHFSAIFFWDPTFCFSLFLLPHFFLRLDFTIHCESWLSCKDRTPFPSFLRSDISSIWEIMTIDMFVDGQSAIWRILGRMSLLLNKNETPFQIK